MTAKDARDAVLEANDRFYRAFRNRDYDTMETLWQNGPDISVHHPGWPGLSGWDDVMESWYRILRIGTPPPIEAHDPHVLVHGRTAMVTCTEDLGEGRLIATNTFVLQDGHWRLTGHQARPLPDPPN